ncbi:MAG TPA: YciI family protein [Longimicrobiales bacterium]|nr:YciI family protein [Longimicrobiales bacterium]
MPRFMLLAYDDPATLGDIAPDEMQRIVERYIAWTERLAAGGHLLQSDKLVDGAGRRVTRRAGELAVRDGPFAESREVLGGFWLLRADDYDHAVRLAADCPHTEFGELEVREVEELDS